MRDQMMALGPRADRVLIIKFTSNHSSQSIWVGARVNSFYVSKFTFQATKVLP